MPCYSVKNWTMYEHHDFKRCRMSWVKQFNKHDGDGYRTLMKANRDRYLAWTLILQVASKCPTRGLLVDDRGRNLGAQELSTKTDCPASVFEDAFRPLIEVGWLEDLDDIRGASPKVWGPSPKVPGRGEEIREEERTAEKTAEPLSVSATEFQEAWNALGKPFPRIAEWTDKRAKALRVRSSESFFVANWRAALARVCVSEFCRGAKGWVADAEWFLRPGVVAKVIEGNFDNRNGGGGKIDWDAEALKVARAAKGV